MSLKDLSSENFHEVVDKQPGKVLVDCYAEWCPPCKLLAPIVDELSEELTDIAFYKLDIDKSPAIVIEYDIASIPTLLLFEDGKLANRSLGFKSKSALKKFLG